MGALVVANKTLDALLAKLKRLNPARVRVCNGDDDVRDIAVPTRRKKWGQVIETIEGRAWSRVELLNKSGEVLGYHDNTEPATELESLDGDTRTAKTRSDMEWMANVIIKAQREVLTFRDSELQGCVKAMGDVVREMGTAVHSLGSVYQLQVAATKETEAVKVAAAATAAGQGDSFKELMEALPQIMQALPMLRALLQGATGRADNTAKPKNGA